MNKTLLAIIFGLFVLPSAAQELDSSWYVGVSYGYDFSDGKFSNEPSQKLQNKYGILGGYRLNNWLSLESGFTKHESISETFCDSPNTNHCVVWQREHQYAFIGAKGTLGFASDALALSFGLAGIMGDYKSNFDRQSFNYLSPSFGITWLMSEEISLALDTEVIKYPMGNKQESSIASYKLTLILDL